MARRPPVRAERPLDEDELRSIVARLAREGNMPAARFYFETWIRPASVREVSPDGDDPLREVDELARRRGIGS